MKIDSCRFVVSAFRPEDAPSEAGPDVVLFGRSNVGKSSLINRLLGVRGLARTSSEPGRTQSVNFYRVNERWHVVDLPGYGFARVPERVRRGWQAMIEGTLERRRKRIVLGLLVVDARHEPSPLDRTMHEWLDAARIDHLVLATKADKLPAGRRAGAKRRLAAAALGTGDEPILVSAQTGLGIPSVWRHLDRALAACG